MKFQVTSNDTISVRTPFERLEANLGSSSHRMGTLECFDP